VVDVDLGGALAVAVDAPIALLSFFERVIVVAFLRYASRRSREMLERGLQGKNRS
jgi:hypothetical protein